MEAAVIAALIAGLVALVTSLVTARVTQRVADSRALIDEKLALLKGDIDQKLAAQKAELDNKTVFAAERVVHALMKHGEWRWRTFRVIRHHLGGFEDDELRKILVRAGAIRSVADGHEVWGLLERNAGEIGVEQLSVKPAGGGEMTVQDFR